MNEQGKRAVRADLGLSFDPWDLHITRSEQRLVILGLWKREVRKFQRYVPDYSEPTLMIRLLVTAFHTMEISGSA
jgi:hypothetical protein